MIFFSIYHIYTAKTEINKTLCLWNAQQNKIESKKGITANGQLGKVKISLEKDNTSRQQTNTQDQNNTLEIEDSISEVKPIDYGEIVYGDIIGKLTYANKALPVVTGIADNLLKKGVLHYGDTVLPGLEGNSILLGHRDSVFKDLGELKLDDTFNITTKNNNLYFQVVDIRILKSDDLSIFNAYDFPSVSLVTCYPFHYLASKTERYVVVGKRLIFD